jgi:membrane-associated phospholipid phosphatase
MPSSRTLSIALSFAAILAAGPAYSEPPSDATKGQVSTLPASEAALTTRPAESSTSSDSLSLDYVKGIFSDTGRIITSPGHWDSGDWLKAGAVVGITGGLFFVDAGIRDFAQRNQSPVAGKFATAGNDLGNPLYTLPPVAAFYLYGYVYDDRKARRASLLAVESLAISSLFTEILKETTQRNRPNSGASPETWNGPHFSTKNVSFCSGHTSSAFSMATVFAEEYRDTWYVPPIAYGLATLTGLSRIYSNEHWASDVFFGAAVGYFVGQTVVRYHQNALTNNVSVTPVLSSEYKGVAVSVNF